jgi:hypothetical protein
MDHFRPVRGIGMAASVLIGLDATFNFSVVAAVAAIKVVRRVTGTSPLEIVTTCVVALQVRT